MLIVLSNVLAAARHVAEALRDDKPRLLRLVAAGFAVLHLIQATHALLVE